MDTRKFGRTKLEVTPIGLGLAALGRPGYINIGHSADLNGSYAVGAMETRAHAVLDAAYKNGVRYFDAARSYGRAEEFLGSWLRSREISPASIVIGSKWGYTYTADWKIQAEAHEIKEHSLDVLRKQWSESTSTLGEHLNLYQIHSATLASAVLENEQVLGQLAAMKNDGLAIGLSVSGTNQRAVIERAIATEIEGVPLFDSIQATWNLLETSAESSLAMAREAGMGVIIKEALANGRLTDRNSSPGFAEKMALLHSEAARLSTSIDALALAAVLAQPWVDIVLSGAAREEHLLSNLSALDVLWDATAEDNLGLLTESTEEYWRRRSRLKWN